MNRFICIHGHFYQPPRENPWLEEIEVQDSAYPYHDWNARITAECYAPNAASRILDSNHKIINIVNNYSKMSFNFGAPLLNWMQKHSPDVYQAILDADIESQKRFQGHGSAIAQAYNHIIMPLANFRDKRTQIIWGIKDFESRFKRKPEGMWLPETAVDLETLDILAEFGIVFTILSPLQAKRIKKINDKNWIDISDEKIDPKMPYICKLPSRKNIVLFFYDGPISRDVAFSNILSSGETFAKRMLDGFQPDHSRAQLCNIASDGETYGHHHRFADMALAYCIHFLESKKLAELTIYAQYLDNHPAEYEVEIFQNSSWSCTHGVERWRSDCGCKLGRHAKWNQKWRAPLRAAMDWLRDSLLTIYEKEALLYLHDPWSARDDYINVILDRSEENIAKFFLKHAKKELDKEERVRVLKLLEMQRNSMLMYTSCGWFFDEITGIETVQIIHFAARAIQLARQITGEDLEEEYIKLLEKAPSNLKDVGNGSEVYLRFVRPAVIDILRVAVHYAASSLFNKYSKNVQLYSYSVESDVYDQVSVGKKKLIVGRCNMRSDITLEEFVISFAVLHSGGQNLIAGARIYNQQDAFDDMHRQIKEAFLKEDIVKLKNLIEKYFQDNIYTLRHLFRDEQYIILSEVFEDVLMGVESRLHEIYEDYYLMMQGVNEMGIPLPRSILSVVETIYNRDIRILLGQKEINLNKIKELIKQIKNWNFSLDIVTFGYILNEKITVSMEKFFASPQDLGLLQGVLKIFEVNKLLELDINLWKCQNMYFSLGKQLLLKMRENSARAVDHEAGIWLENFLCLGEYLNAKLRID